VFSLLVVMKFFLLVCGFFFGLLVCLSSGFEDKVLSCLFLLYFLLVGKLSIFTCIF